jgi:hypothetical protein
MILQHELETANYDRQSLDRIQPLLPAEDDELDALIERLLSEDAGAEFCVLVLAALAANRPVDARHLVRGTAALLRQGLLSMSAMRMCGDVGRYFLQALDTGSFDHAEIAVVLFLVAIWCREVGKVEFPAELLLKTREILRLRNVPTTAGRVLLAMALYMNDEGLLTIFREQFPSAEQKWQDARKRALAAVRYVAGMCRKPLGDTLPEKQNLVLGDGKTMRRAVARFSRNEKCRCGSGKKYKHCCLERDSSRLRCSTDIAGVSLGEIADAADRVFTPARMDSATRLELERIDPSKLSSALLERYISRLNSFRQFDLVAGTFEKLGYSDGLLSVWNTAVESAAVAGRKDVVARLIAVRRPHGFTDDQLPPVCGFLMVEDDLPKCLAFIEDKIRELLESDDAKGLSELAYAVLISRFPALGIALSRAVVPLLAPADAAQLMRHLFRARNRLNLVSEDAIGSVLGTLAVGRGEDAGASEAYREAQAKFEAQRSATRQLREEMEAERKERKRLEHVQAQPHVTPSSAAPAPLTGGEKSRLERKIKYLEEQIEAFCQHENRDHQDMEATPAVDPGNKPDASGMNREQDLLLDAETQGTQPVRLLVFSRDFGQRLSGAPRHVARSAMTMLGHLAGGEPAAFAGAVRLKACPAVMRHRIGIDWRLLFRILPDRIDAIDLIPRQDLERRIKTLVTQYA